MNHIEVQDALYNINKKQDPNLLDDLIEKIGGVNEPDSTMKRTLLMHCASLQLVDVLKMLLEKGANLDIRDKDGKTASDIAAKYNNKDILDLLKGHQSHFAKPDLKAAIEANNLTLVKSIINGGVDVNEPFGPDKETALAISIKMASIDIVRFLIENGADVNQRSGVDEETPIKILFAKQQTVKMLRFITILELLIKNGADVNLKCSNIVKETPIEYFLIPLGTKFDSDTNSVVKLLINAGANVNKLYQYCKSNGLEMENTYSSADAAIKQMKSYKVYVNGDASEASRILSYPDIKKIIDAIIIKEFQSLDSSQASTAKAPKPSKSQAESANAPQASTSQPKNLGAHNSDLDPSVISALSEAIINLKKSQNMASNSSQASSAKAPEPSASPADPISDKVDSLKIVGAARK